LIHRCWEAEKRFTALAGVITAAADRPQAFGRLIIPPSFLHLPSSQAHPNSSLLNQEKASKKRGRMLILVKPIA